MKFHTTVLQAGKTTTGIEVPAEVVEGLGGGKRPAVKVTLNNSYTYRSTIAPMRGTFMIGINADVREAAHVAGGDKVEVELELDTEPRVLTPPADLQKALDGDKAAKEFFDSLSYSKKWGVVYPIEHAKTEETRQRRIVKAIEMLRAHKIR